MGIDMVHDPVERNLSRVSRRTCSAMGIGHVLGMAFSSAVHVSWAGPSVKVLGFTLTSAVGMAGSYERLTSNGFLFGTPDIS